MSSSDDSDSFASGDEDIDVPTDEQNASQPLDGHEQWVKSIEYCSYRSNYQEAVPRGSGVEKLCQAADENFTDKGSIDHEWILSNNNQEEHLIVSFETAVFISEIHIYESLNPGCIVKLEMLESQRNKWWTMWQRKSSTKGNSLTKNIFKPILRRYHLQSKTIRVTIDPTSTDRIGIQAIKLTGSNTFDCTLHRTTIHQVMTKLYQQTRDPTNGDVQFLIDGKIISAHQNILCCRSAYFRSLLLGDFSERNRTQPIELTDIDSHTFMEILFYLYTGSYRLQISYEMTIKCMIYCNKITFLPGKNAALEQICRQLSIDHDLILSVYCLVKQMSPAFDHLLDYIYDLCSQHMNEICKQKEFSELGKEFMVDLICQSADRRDQREQEKNNPTTGEAINATHGSR